MIRLTGAWLRSRRTQGVCAVLGDAGHQVLLVGGCVRNALLGERIGDIDIATDALPEQVTALAEAAGLRVVPTGLAHGTVTLVARGRAFEITTFRRDVETFGRHARVAFSSDIAEDAARRDFTLNALYAHPDGRVIDPLGGLPDLRARRIRFVGDPARRIAEDGLRILRFFRFHGWYGDPAGGLDAEGLAACAHGQDGLDQLSRERVGGEMTRLLAAPDPAPALAAMAAPGILRRVLPGANPAALAALARLERDRGVPARWQRRLAVLGGPADWPERLRLSKADRRVLRDLDTAAGAGEGPAVAAYRFGPLVARDAALIAAARSGAPPRADLEAEIGRGEAARLPLGAADLALAGPALGAALKRAEAAWIASDLTLDATDLRARTGLPPAAPNTRS